MALAERRIHTFDVPLVTVTGEEFRPYGRDGWYGIDVEDDGCNSPEQEAVDGSHLAGDLEVVVLRGYSSVMTGTCGVGL